MATISQVTGFEILDSRGNPTVAARVTLSDGAQGFAAAPSGASTGSREVEQELGAKAAYAGRAAFRVTPARSAA